MKVYVVLDVPYDSYSDEVDVLGIFRSRLAAEQYVARLDYPDDAKIVKTEMEDEFTQAR